MDGREGWDWREGGREAKRDERGGERGEERGEREGGGGDLDLLFEVHAQGAALAPPLSPPLPLLPLPPTRRSPLLIKTPRLSAPSPRIHLRPPPIACTRRALLLHAARTCRHSAKHLRLQSGGRRGSRGRAPVGRSCAVWHAARSPPARPHIPLQSPQKRMAEECGMLRARAAAMRTAARRPRAVLVLVVAADPIPPRPPCCIHLRPTCFPPRHRCAPHQHHQLLPSRQRPLRPSELMQESNSCKLCILLLTP